MATNLTPETIRETRRRLGLTQAAFAALLRETVPGLGTTRVTVNRWENGVHPPDGVAAAVIRRLNPHEVGILIPTHEQDADVQRLIEISNHRRDRVALAEPVKAIALVYDVQFNEVAATRESFGLFARDGLDGRARHRAAVRAALLPWTERGI
jgi:transcriptional regulator with XRE-family HTH domain